MLFETFRLLTWAVLPSKCYVCQKPLGAFSKIPCVCVFCYKSLPRIQPPFCQSCGRTVHPEAAQCQDCVHENFHFDKAYCCIWYKDSAKKLLLQYKYHHARELSGLFQKIISDFILQYCPGTPWDAVAALPISRDKLRERGYNQSFLLSNFLAKTFGLQEFSGCLRRHKTLSPQSKLAKSQRRANVFNSFEITDSLRFKDSRILLVDDILTTGQTASECARILKSEGARSVTVLALARGVAE